MFAVFSCIPNMKCLPSSYYSGQWQRNFQSHEWVVAINSLLRQVQYFFSKWQPSSVALHFMIKTRHIYEWISGHCRHMTTRSLMLQDVNAHNPTTWHNVESSFVLMSFGLAPLQSISITRPWITMPRVCNFIKPSINEICSKSYIIIL